MAHDRHLHLQDLTLQECWAVAEALIAVGNPAKGAEVMLQAQTRFMPSVDDAIAMGLVAPDRPPRKLRPIGSSKLPWKD